MGVPVLAPELAGDPIGANLRLADLVRELARDCKQPAQLESVDSDRQERLGAGAKQVLETAVGRAELGIALHVDIDYLEAAAAVVEDAADVALAGPAVDVQRRAAAGAASEDVQHD